MKQRSKTLSAGDPGCGSGKSPDRTPGLKIGLTGGIGSGKSTVARMLVDLGAVLVDTDAIARELTAPGGAAIPALRQAFGPEALGADGALDRDWMRARVFSDPQAKGRLEAILHPLIGELAGARAAAAAPATVVFDVPLLVESGRWRARVDRVLVVDCREQTQVERVMARNGWPAETVQRIIAQQATRAQRRAAADAVIDNDGPDLPALSAEVGRLWRRWHEEALALQGDAVGARGAVKSL
jgi:dephospho-CoA kinase